MPRKRVFTHKIAVVGSRPVPGDHESVRRHNELRRSFVVAFVNKLDPDTNVLISGGATGVDRWAAERAKERDIETIILKPDWNKYGRGAGFRRNKQIVAEADSVVAFWDGDSKGTEHTFTLAIKARKHTAIFSVLTGELLREFVPTS